MKYIIGFLCLLNIFCFFMYSEATHKKTSRDPFYTYSHKKKIQPPPQKKPSTKKICVTGITWRNDTFYALLKYKNEEELVKTGDVIWNFLVKKITHHNVTIQKGTRTKTIEIEA